RRAVDRLDPAVRVQRDERAGPQVGVAQTDAVDTLGEPAGQTHPVVGRARLLGEDGDAIAARVVPGAQRLDQPLRDHAAAGHDEVLRGTGVDHVLTVGPRLFALVRRWLPGPNICLTPRGGGV